MSMSVSVSAGGAVCAQRAHTPRPPHLHAPKQTLTSVQTHPLCHDQSHTRSHSHALSRTRAIAVASTQHDRTGCLTTHAALCLAQWRRSASLTCSR
eukprot:954520-Rhodomonas_salina.1